jgi:CRISPR-associated protein Cas2
VISHHHDVNTETWPGKNGAQGGQGRQNYGQRVQNSVFECVIDPARLKQLQNTLTGLMDADKDSIRYYYLGDDWRSRVVHVGAKASLDLEGVLIT